MLDPWLNELRLLDRQTLEPRYTAALEPASPVRVDAAGYPVAVRAETSTNSRLPE